jgi:hypothetical protein
MTYLITEPYYVFPDNSGVSCIWDNPELGLIPFLASPNDCTTYGPEIYAQCVAGDYGPVVSYEDSHWYSTVDNNEWEGFTYNTGYLMLSPTGQQPPNSSNQPIPPNPNFSAS